MVTKICGSTNNAVNVINPVGVYQFLFQCEKDHFTGHFYCLSFLKHTHDHLFAVDPPKEPRGTKPKAVFIHENRQAIKSKFASLLINICDKMVKNGNVNVEQFRLYVIALFPPGDCIPHSLTNLTDIFEAITRHGLWDFFHYSPLAKIVNKFGANDPDMNKWVQDYMKDLKSYNSITQITDCIELVLANSTEPSPAKYDPRYNRPVEWKTNFIDHTLQYLAEVWEMFSSHYLLPDSPPTALLDCVRRGCVSITWLVPTRMIPQLIKGVESNTDFFQEHHISKVIVDGKCLYEVCSCMFTKSNLIGKSFFSHTVNA